MLYLHKFLWCTNNGTIKFMFVINFLNDAPHSCSSNMCTIPRYKIVKPMVYGNRYMEGICSCLLWNSYGSSLFCVGNICF